MTQTLTTEAMQEIYEAAVHSEASGSQEAEFELLCKLEDVGGTSATIRKLIDKVRAANREPQPVTVPEFLTYLREPIISNVLANDDNSPMANAARILACEVKFWRSQPLFTAPPAPAYPETLPCAVRLMPGLLFGKGVKTRLMLEALGRREEFEAEMDAMTPEQKAEQDAAIKALFSHMTPPAPAVPDGYKLMPLEITDEIGEAIAMEARCCGGIALDIYEAALAAAPEGGNG